VVAEGGGGLAWRGAVVVRGEKRSEKGRRGAWKRRVDLARSDGVFGFGLGVAQTGGGASQDLYVCCDRTFSGVSFLLGERFWFRWSVRAAGGGRPAATAFGSGSSRWGW
jgi:hypothetical protein